MTADKLENIAEEINLYLGLKAEVKGFHIVIDTIAGEIKYSPSEKTVMGDVYRDNTPLWIEISNIRT